MVCKSIYFSINWTISHIININIVSNSCCLYQISKVIHWALYFQDYLTYKYKIQVEKQMIYFVQNLWITFAIKLQMIGTLLIFLGPRYSLLVEIIFSSEAERKKSTQNKQAFTIHYINHGKGQFWHHQRKLRWDWHHVEKASSVGCVLRKAEAICH